MKEIILTALTYTIFGLFSSPTVAGDLPTFSNLLNSAAENSFNSNCDANKIAPKLKYGSGFGNKEISEISCDDKENIPELAETICKKGKKVLCQNVENNPNYICFVEPKVIPSSGINKGEVQYQPRFAYAFSLQGRKSFSGDFFKMDHEGCQTEVYSTSIAILSNDQSSQDVRRKECLRAVDLLKVGRSKINLKEDPRMIGNSIENDAIGKICAQGSDLQGWELDSLMAFIGKCSKGFPYIAENRNTRTQLIPNLKAKIQHYDAQ